jgi:hypothetical protein
MKKIFTLVVILITAYLNNAQAKYIGGAEISYKSLGNSKYEVTVIAYRDCNASQLSNVPVDYRCVSGSGSGSYTLTEVSVTDVTGVNPHCTSKSRCSGSLSYGIEKHVYVGTIDLSSFQCCEITISWQQCCRLSTITNTTAGQNLYVEAMINKCVDADIQWSAFDPSFVLPVGQDVSLNFSVLNSMGIDSVSYKLVAPLSASGATISYNGSFSPTKPVTFLGFPNVGLNSPAGLQFDNQRGNLSFRPTNNKEVSTIVVEAKKWRSDSGIMRVVAKSIRDISVYVITLQQPNSVPKQTDSNNFLACPGDTSVAIIDFTDNDNGNTFTVNMEHNLKWAKAQRLGDSTSKKIIVSYLVDSIPAQGIPNAFTVEVYDNTCPLRGRSVKTYGILGGGNKFADSSYIRKSKACKHAYFKPGNRLVGTNFEYSWLITTKNKKQGGTVDNFDFLVQDTGWIKAQLWVTSKTHCNYYVYTDSIYIDPTDVFTVDAGNDTAVCSSSLVTLSARQQYGVPPIKYSWSNGDTNATTTITPQQGYTKYTVNLIDGRGCAATDWVLVTNYQPKIDITADTIICKNSITTLTGAVNNAIDFKSSYWNGLPAGVDTFTEKLALPKLYTYNVVDGFCLFSKSIQVNISEPQIKYTHDTVVCIGDTMTLSVAASNGKPPYKVNWLPFNKTGPIVYITTKNAAAGHTYFNATVTDALGCSTTKAGSVLLNPKPVITLLPFAKVCVSTPQINLIPYASPAGGVWSGQGIVGNSLSPSVLGRGTHSVSYKYTDSASGCFTSGDTKITVFAPPVIDFVADSANVLKGTSLHFTNLTTADGTFSSKWVFGLPATPANTLTNTNPNFVFNDTGFHSVKLVISDGVCPQDSIIKANYIYVRLKNGANGINMPLANKLIIYPNPAKNSVTLETDFDIKAVKITDITGRVFTVAVYYNGTKAIINLESLDAGSYIINAQSIDGETITTPVIINR